jgi:hypothetical protein
MKQKRKIIRMLHIIGAILIGTFIYSPYGSIEWFQAMIKFAVIPLLSISGLLLYKPKLLKK